MRNIFFYIFFLCFVFLRAQIGLFINGPDASLRVDSSGFLSIQGDLQNMDCDPLNQVRFNGTLYLAGNLINNDILKFTAATGATNSKKARIVFNYTSAYTTGFMAGVGGSVTPNFWEIELDKSLAGSLTLSTNINCSDTLTFKLGFIYMNGFKFNLVDPVGASVVNHPYLKNERHGCQFTPSSINDTGLIILNTIYNLPMDLDPANIGISITGSVNVGSTFKVRRGFAPQVNAGKTGVLRYFDIHSSGHALGINGIKVKYIYNDFMYFGPGYINMPSLKLFVSSGADINWSPLPSVIQNTIVSPILPNGLLSASLSDLSLPNISIPDTLFRITIADPNCSNLPVSALLLDTLYVCAGNTITLDAGNNSSVPNSSLRWEWDTNPKLYTQTHTVTPTSGYQKLKVTLMDARGCDTKDSVVIAPPAPYPQITYFNHLNSCLGDSVTIKDTVKIISGTYTNSWLFSDASASGTMQKFFKKKFATVGDHSIQLTATSNYGCSVTATSTNVLVYPLPTAGFTASLDCATSLVTFTNTSVSNHTALVISGALWNLGQGVTNTSTLLSPSQTYSSSGTYTVKLLSTSSFGCKDSLLAPLTIYPTNIAQFVKNNSCFLDTVFFNNTSICATGSCSYHWNFGDATNSTLSSPKKVYAALGFYAVKLKVTNPFGCADSISTSVFVNPKPNASFATTNTNVCINDFIYFTNNSSITSGSISNFSWNLGNATTSSLTNAATTYSNSGFYNVSLFAASDSGCVNNFSLVVDAKPQPFSQYSLSDVCLGTPSQFVSSSTGQGLTYIWHYGNSVITNTSTANVQNYSYPSAGIYATQLITFNTWGCSDTTSLTTTVFTSPVAALGGSVSTCGTAYTLNAGNPGSNFLWQPGNQITPTVQVNSNGIYQVSITNANNCVGTETVLVTLNAIVKPHLGNDSTVCGAFILNAGYPGSVYLWNTSATSQTITANTSTVFIVQVTDLNGCSGSDSIHLIVNTPATLNLGNNLTVCKPKYGLVLSPTTNATTFLWSNGLSTSTLNVTSSGSYWLDVTAANGCKQRDTVTISFLNTPSIDLGADRSACGNILLDAQNSGSSYLWNDGSTNQFLTATTSANYYITVTNTLNACFQQDSVSLFIHPLATVYLGNDTTLCNNANFLLNAKNSGATYSWTSGQTSQTIPITSSGIYGVTVTNSGGCFASDYISVTLIGSPIVNLGADVRYLCGNNSVILALPNTGQISWGSSTGISSSTHSVNTFQPGKYWATVSAFGCSASDSVIVIATNNTIQALFLASTQDTVNKPVKFVNLSTPTPVSQLWSFGDGLTSNALNPIHTFVLPQDFSVTLEVSNGFCTDIITKQLSVLFKQKSTPIHQPIYKLELLAFNVWPNPANNYLQVYFELNDFATVALKIFDSSGRMLFEENTNENLHYSTRLNMDDFKNGLYFINIRAQSNKGTIIKTTKFIKTN